MDLIKVFYGFWSFVLNSVVIVGCFNIHGDPIRWSGIRKKSFQVIFWVGYGSPVFINAPLIVKILVGFIYLTAIYVFLFWSDDWRNKQRRLKSAIKLKTKQYMAYGMPVKSPVSV
jgi:hypothetical protein